MNLNLNWSPIMEKPNALSTRDTLETTRNLHVDIWTLAQAQPSKRQRWDILQFMEFGSFVLIMCFKSALRVYVYVVSRPANIYLSSSPDPSPSWDH